jgi:ubiquinone/menaquinone biosynthesis C-methylase UbiE
MEMKLSPEILAYYQQAAESTRLQSGPSQLECARTKEVIGRWLGHAPSVILDVGGGPGAYSAWLAHQGHEVHLVDPVAEHVAHARSLRGNGEREIASCRVGDARSLDRGDQSADAVLLLGPLYHLMDAADRRKALREAYRVLAPGGLLFAAAISRFASALDGLAQDLFADPEFDLIVRRDLAEGIHENPTGRLEFFTTAKFHRPEELAAEVRDAGFSVLSIVGLEGPGWLFPDFNERWQDPRRRADILRVARALESEPSIQAVSAHILAVARRDA